MNWIKHTKKSRGIGVAIVLMVLAVGLIAGSGMIRVRNNEQAELLNNMKVQAENLRTSREELSNKINEIQEKSNELTYQIEALSQEIAQLQENGVDVGDIASQVGEEKRYAYLTFDDGPSDNTVKILDFLKANNIQATFFVLTREGYDDVYKRIVDEGHTIALHSTDHVYSRIYQTVESFMEDIEEQSRHIQELTGVETKVLRFPGGSNNGISKRYGGESIMEDIIQRVDEDGYVYFDWNVDSNDAAKSIQDKNVIVNSVLSQAQRTKNATILMHDGYGKATTVEALPEIVSGLREQGFLFRGLTVDTPAVQF